MAHTIHRSRRLEIPIVTLLHAGVTSLVAQPTHGRSAPGPGLPFETDVPVFALTVILVLLTVILVWLTFLLVKREQRRRRHQKELIKKETAKRLRIGDLVGAYEAQGITTYLPITADVAIDNALVPGCRLLLTGRPGLGKTHAVVSHIIRKYPNWSLLRPTMLALSTPDDIRVRHRIRVPFVRHPRHVLLFDDLDRYLLAMPAASANLDLLIETIRYQSSQLIVVGTIRNTSPEFDTFLRETRMVRDWHRLDLANWSDTQGARLAQMTGLDMGAWDATPLSVKSPRPLMAARYEQASLRDRTLLRALKLLRACGLKPCDRALVREVVASAIFSGGLDNVDPAIDSVAKQGFLRLTSDPIDAYDPYLDGITDWDITDRQRVSVRRILLHGGHVEALLAFALRLEREGAMEEAEECLIAAASAQPHSAMAHYRLGVHWLRRGECERARGELERTTELAIGWDKAWRALASALRATGDKKGANRATARARKLAGPDAVRSRIGRAEVLREEGRVEEAIEEFAAIVREHPREADAHYGLGRTLRLREEWGAAKTAFEAALKINPQHGESLFGLAEPLVRLGERRRAEQCLRQAIVLLPGLLDAHVTLVHTLIKAGNLTEADAVISTALERFPSAAILYSYRGQLYSLRRMFPEAIAAYEKGLDLDASNANAHMGLAGCLRFVGNLDGALAHNQRALEINPSFAEAHYGLALCLVDAGDGLGALKAFDRAVTLKPEYAAAHYYRGKQLETLHRVPEALEAFSQARKHGYRPDKCAYERGKCLMLLDPSCSDGRYLGEVINCLRESVALGFDLGRIRANPIFVVLDAVPNAWDQIAGT